MTRSRKPIEAREALGAATAPTVTLQTPPGRGGVAIVQLAGPGAASLGESIFEPLRPGPLAVDALRLGWIVDGRRRLDEVLLCSTPRGDLEINLHGGPVVAAEVLDLLARRGARVVDAGAAAAPALPLAHQRWDNPAIGRELLAWLPAAAGPRLLETLANQWSGGLSELAARPAPCSESLVRASDRSGPIRRLLAGAEVAIVGPPNAGKSALANALVGRDASIVDDRAGTTRDWVRSAAVIDGWPIWITDTAGLWNSPDPLDVESVRRTRRRATRADVVILLDEGEPWGVPDWLAGPAIIRVSSKCDLRPALAGSVAVSSRTGVGLDALGGAILAALGVANQDPTCPAAFTQRQADLCLLAAEATGEGDLTAAGRALDELLRAPGGREPPRDPGDRGSY
jgi:tRNA modification GTPase